MFPHEPIIVSVKSSSLPSYIPIALKVPAIYTNGKIVQKSRRHINMKALSLTAWNIVSLLSCKGAASTKSGFLLIKHVLISPRHPNIPAKIFRRNGTFAATSSV